MSAPITEAHLDAAEKALAMSKMSEVAQLIADSEAAAVQTAMIREYGNLCATNEGLAKERDKLRAEVERLKTCGIVEIAASNPSVLDYCKHWEARAQRAEAEVERLTKQAVFDGDHIHTLNAAFATRAEVMDAIARAERAEAELKSEQDNSVLAEAELATERARLDDLVADLNDACITLASAKDDCDDYALLNTGFKLTAVRDVLLQYIPPAALKEGK